MSTGHLSLCTLTSILLFSGLLVATKGYVVRGNQIIADVPKRLFLKAEDILFRFTKNEFHSRENEVDARFTYELVEPTACQMLRSTFGCCWDNRTVALGTNGEGCPACIDQRKSCRKWKDLCHENLVKWVCPQTCDLCPAKQPANCKDEDQHCALYKRLGLCGRQQITAVCKNTCASCNDPGHTADAGKGMVELDD